MGIFTKAALQGFARHLENSAIELLREEFERLQGEVLGAYQALCDNFISNLSHIYTKSHKMAQNMDILGHKYGSVKPYNNAETIDFSDSKC